MPRHITTKELAQAARSYHSQGLLAAQQPPKVHGYRCRYSYPGHDCRCAIGAALTPQDLAALEKAKEDSCLVHALSVITFEDLGLAARLQFLHDSWLNNGTGEAHFLKFLEFLEFLP